MILFDITASMVWFVIKLWFITHWGFLACIKLKEMKAAGTLNKYWMHVGIPIVPIFLVCDVLFNVIWGTIIYRELPRIPPFVKWEEREWLFTDRCKRHYRAVAYSMPTTIHSPKTMKRYRASVRWKIRLNVIEANHIY